MVKIIRWRLLFFRALKQQKQMPLFDLFSDPNGYPRVLLSDPGGSCAEVLLSQIYMHVYMNMNEHNKHAC